MVENDMEMGINQIYQTEVRGAIHMSTESICLVLCVNRSRERLRLSYPCPLQCLLRRHRQLHACCSKSLQNVIDPIQRRPSYLVLYPCTQCDCPEDRVMPVVNHPNRDEDVSRCVLILRELTIRLTGYPPILASEDLEFFASFAGVHHNERPVQSTWKCFVRCDENSEWKGWHWSWCG